MCPGALCSPCDMSQAAFDSVQFNSKTLIIPQGAILLLSWRARKIIIHKVKKTITIQQTQHHQQKSLTLTIVIIINIERL